MQEHYCGNGNVKLYQSLRVHVLLLNQFNLFIKAPDSHNDTV